jgi:hypothetical protein
LFVLLAFIFGVRGTWYWFMCGRFRYDENGNFIIDKSKK